MRPTLSEGEGSHADSIASIRVSLAVFVWEIDADPSVWIGKRLTTSWGTVADRKRAIIVSGDEREATSTFSDEKTIILVPQSRFCEV